MNNPTSAPVQEKHTPGKWRTGPVNYADIYSEETGELVCLVVKDRPGTLADARLIAAAPELLAALREIVARNEIQHWFNLDQARAAISKAVSGE